MIVRRQLRIRLPVMVVLLIWKRMLQPGVGTTAASVGVVAAGFYFRAICHRLALVRRMGLREPVFGKFGRTVDSETTLESLPGLRAREQTLHRRSSCAVTSKVSIYKCANRFKNL